MRVILSQNYPKLGYLGDTLEVKPGYARNYLIPKGIAAEVSSGSAKQLNHVISGILARRTKMKGEAQAMSKRMGSTTLEFTLKMTEGGKSFGAVTSRDIEAALHEKGYQVDRKQIRLVDTIKSAGKYSVEIKLHAEVSASIPITVSAENLPEGDDKRAGKKSAGKGRSRKTDSEATTEEV